MATILTNNPFPADAVATFGHANQPSGLFEYMRVASDQLYGYLKAHADPARRYGGGIGICGAHGGGKTHVLGWLAQLAAEFKSTSVSCVYAKADSTSTFDLYRQFFTKGFDREYLVDLLQKAAIAVATEQVGLARITEGLAASIKDGGLQSLYESKQVDREAVLAMLHERMLGAKFPTTIARCLLDLPDATVGPKAYAWLLGDTTDMSEYGLPAHPLRQAGAESDGSSAADDAAADALEAVAFLHDIAGVPFVVCIDQLEVFLRTDIPARAQTMFSVIKKVIEQVSRQNGLLFIAGTAGAWGSLPRDVSPRMRLRQPIVVGNLTVPETAALVKAYLSGQPLPPPIIEKLHELSGGSPREVLRICYQAFERSDGDLASASPQQLVESARDAGTLGDRRQLCLAQADEVLERYGTVVHNFIVTDDASPVERLLQQDGRPIVALMTTIASDMVAEASTARQVQRVRARLEQEWPHVELIVVAVGYSSREIADVFGATVTTLVFDERTFARELESALVRLAARAAAPAAAVEPDTQVVKFLQEVARRLDQIEASRTQQAESIQTLVTSEARAVAAPSLRERELRTRWELLEELERLEDTIRSGHPSEERAIIRALLVANEAYTQDPLLDQLGAAYLDVLAIVLNYRADGASAARLRTDLAAEMRRTLRRKPWERWLRQPGRLAAIAAALAIVATCYWQLSRAYSEFPLDAQPSLVAPYYVLPALGTALLAAAAAFALAWATSPTRRWRETIDRFRSRQSQP